MNQLVNNIAKIIVMTDKASITSMDALWIKIQSLAIISVLVSPFAFIVEKLNGWLELNIAFASFMIGAIIIDHILGSYVHAFIKKDFQIKKNAIGLVVKTSLVVTVMYLGEGIIHILGNSNAIGAYATRIIQLMVFFYPAGSALVNCAIITGGKFPPVGFMKKINSFNENLDMKSFKSEEENKGK